MPNILDEFCDRTLEATELHRDADGIPGFIYRTRDGREWKWIRHDIDFAKVTDPLWVSMGSIGLRENLLFDANSPRLLELREQVIQQTIGKPTREILEIVNQIVSELIEIPGKTRAERYGEISTHFDLFLLTRDDLNVPIDELIEAKMLVCRHNAILTAYILGDLVRMGILPPGEVRHHRTDIRFLSSLPQKQTDRFGAHSWAIYAEKDGNKDIWICDPTYQYTLNVNNSVELGIASREYGGPTIVKMLDSLDDQSGGVSPLLPTEAASAAPSSSAPPSHLPPSPIPPVYTPLAMAPRGPWVPPADTAREGPRVRFAPWLVKFTE